MTDAQLGTWLATKGCWTAIRFDGSHSSVVVAKRPGRKLAVVNKQTNKGGPRKVVNGLFVVSTR